MAACYLTIKLHEAVRYAILVRVSHHGGVQSDTGERTNQTERTAAVNDTQRIECGQLDGYAVSGSSPPVSAPANTTPTSDAATRNVEPIPRITLCPEEAALALGVGRTFFFQSVLPELAIVRRGRKRLIPVFELARWAERNAARLPLEGA